MNYVIGIDPGSTKLAWVLCDLEGVVIDWDKIKLPTPYSAQTALVASEIVDTALFEGKIGRREQSPVVYIEAPIVGRGGIRSSMSQAFVSGALQASWASHGSEVYLVHPGTWKKEVLGNGALKKDQIKEKYALLDEPYLLPPKNDEDLIDAFFIARYGVIVQERAKLIKGA